MASKWSDFGMAHPPQSWLSPLRIDKINPCIGLAGIGVIVYTLPTVNWLSGGAAMAGRAPHFLPVHELTPDAFAPFGEVVQPAAAPGQGVPSIHPDNPKLVLLPDHTRLWVMKLPRVGLAFSKIARHRRVTQCLGSLTGEEWFISVAPPGNLSDDAAPRLEDIKAFRIPPAHIIKLHCATWHAGPHAAGTGGMFINLENEDTNVSDNHIVELPQECRYKL